jgi:PAS domain S-box-containing protein
MEKTSHNTKYKKEVDIDTSKHVSQLENQYLSVFNHLNDEIHHWELIRDKNDKIVTWKLAEINLVATQSWRKNKKDILGKTFDEIFGEGSTKNQIYIINEIFESGKPHKQIEFFKHTQKYLEMSRIPMDNFFMTIGRDVTENVMSLKNLADSKDFLKKSSEIAKVGGWQLIDDFNTIYFTESANELLDVPQGYYPKIQDAINIFATENRKTAEVYLENAIKKGTSFDFKSQITTSKGRDIWIRIIGEPEVVNGRCKKLSGIFQDITDQVETEKALKESESFLNKTGQIAKVGGWFLKGDFSRPFWTKGTYDIHELPYDYIPNLEEAVNFYYPEDRKLVTDKIREAVATGKRFEFEARIITAKGNKKWVLSKGEPEIQNGKCVRLSGVFQDITNQKHAELKLAKEEQKFKSIFKNSSVSKFVTNKAGNLLDVNDKACELLGYSYKELISLSIDDIVQDNSQFYKNLLSNINKDVIQSEEVRVTLKNNKQKIVDFYTKRIDHNRYLSTLIDITEKRKAENEKKKAQNQLFQITNSIPGIIYQFVFHKDGSLSMPFVNSNAPELLGFSIEQMKNPEFLFSRIYHEDYQSTVNSIIEANQNEAKWSRVFRVMNSKNEIVWISGQSYGVKDNEGNVVHNGVFFDITDQKLGEFALKSSQQQYQNIVDNLPGVVLRYKLNKDGSDELLYISQSCEKLFEISAEKAMRNVELIWSKIHEDDIGGMQQSIEESAKNLSVWKYEYRLVFPDGRTKWVDLRGVPTKLKDGSFIWDTVGLDITERKKIEYELEEINQNLEKLVDERAKKAIKLHKELELYWLAAEHSQSGVWRFDVRTNALDWDDILYDLFGIDKEEFSGAYEAWESSLHPDDVENSVKALQETIEKRKDLDILFRIIHRKTGEIRYIRGKGKVELDKNGNTIAVFGTNWDVTQEMQLAEQKEKALNDLRKTQLQLIQSEKMASLGVLTSGVAHELNNPLNYISGGYAALYEHLNNNKEADKNIVNEYLDWIKSGTLRATNIVKGLNHFSKDSEDKNEDCNLHYIINDCLMILKNQYVNRININKNFTTDTTIIKGNSGRLHHAILNILCNAIDAITGKGNIYIQTKLKKNYTILTIEDDGSGIPPENLNKVMDPFFTTKSPGKGTGLGLSICHSIIQEHNGMFKINSVVNEGTKVIIELPIN